MTDGNGHRSILDRPRKDSPPGAIDLRPGSKAMVDVGTVAKAVGAVLLAGVAVGVFYFTAIVRPDQLVEATAQARAQTDAVAAASVAADQRLQARAATLERVVARHSDSLSRMSGQLELLVDLEVDRANREGPKSRKVLREAVQKNPNAGVDPEDIAQEE